MVGQVLVQSNSLYLYVRGRAMGLRGRAMGSWRALTVAIFRPFWRQSNSLYVRGRAVGLRGRDMGSWRALTVAILGPISRMLFDCRHFRPIFGDRLSVFMECRACRLHKRDLMRNHQPSLRPFFRPRRSTAQTAANTTMFRLHLILVVAAPQRTTSTKLP